MEKTHIDPGRPVTPRPPDVRSPTENLRSPSGPRSTSTKAPGVNDPLHDLRSLGEYRILRRLGEGGMGAVYLGYDGRHDRQIALKILNDNLTSNQNYIDRFYREAKSGALLNHPNIVRTYGAGQDRTTGMHYLVLEYVDGPSAHTLLAGAGPVPVGDAVHIALDIARGLEHAHSRNIVHRDIKPDNILITRSGVAKLGDLGLAKRTDETSHLTATRQGFGTTAYMPYEQAINAKGADGRSDIYALGATLYHLITGQVPFPGENHLEVVEKKEKGLFQTASSINPDVPTILDVILERMLARQPRDRYQTASELIIDLERSNLSIPVPSFADPDLARKDPWIRACLTVSEPTRLDPESSTTPRANKNPLESEKSEWLVHYNNRSGRPITTRLTVDAIIERLVEGTLPWDATARRTKEDEYEPLTTFAVFRPYLPTLASEPTRTETEIAESRPTIWVLLATAVGVSLLLLALIKLFLPM